jgi:hypothetical protein
MFRLGTPDVCELTLVIADYPGLKFFFRKIQAVHSNMLKVLR